MKFAGDALIIVFLPASDPTTPVASPKAPHNTTRSDPSTSSSSSSLSPAALTTLRAVQCALELQSRVAVYNAGDVSLTLHIGIASGDVYAMHVGGVDDQYEFLLAGSPFGQITKTLKLSQTGEVVVSAQSWSLIATHCHGTVVPENDTGEVLIESVTNPVTAVKLTPLILPPSIGPLLRSYVPIPALNKLGD